MALFNPPAELDEYWTSQDGGLTRIDSMTDSHLHYALAKAYRGEYPDSRTKSLSIEALKREALKRLGPVCWPPEKLSPDGGARHFQLLAGRCRDELDQVKRELDFEQGRRKDMGAINTKLNAIVMKYQQVRAGLGLPPIEIP